MEHGRANKQHTAGTSVCACIEIISAFAARCIVLIEVISPPGGIRSSTCDKLDVFVKVAMWSQTEVVVKITSKYSRKHSELH